MGGYELIAHRGYPSRYPENTRLGFEKALEAGALHLEADVQITADDVPVIFHDRTLTRLCGGKGVVHRKLVAELEKASPFDPERFGTRFKGVRLLLLSDLVALIERHPGVTLYLELKRISLKALGVQRVLDAVLPALGPISERTVLISFSFFALRAARARGWTRLGPVLTKWSQLEKRPVRMLEPEVVFFNYRRLPLGIGYREAGTALALYEVSAPHRAMSLAKRGARFIETDAIGEMIEACRSQKYGSG